MGLFDMGSGGSGGWQGLLGEVARAGAGIYLGQAQAKATAKAQRRAADALSQEPGWGGFSGYQPSYGLNNPPVVYRGPADMARGVGDYYDVLGNIPVVGTIGKIAARASDWAGSWAPTTWNDPTPGPWAADDPRSQDGGPMAGPGGRYDKCGRWVPKRPSDPHQLVVRGIRGTDVYYINRGRPVLFSADIAGVKRVQRVAAICANALLGKATRRASGRRRKKGSRRRKVACRTLTPKQLAAGFGGRAYRK